MAPFTTDLVTAWFVNQANIGLLNRTRIAIEAEGISHPSDLNDFKDLEHVYLNLRKPPRIVGYANAEDRQNQANGRLVDQDPYLVSAKSKLRLDIAMVAVKYYDVATELLFDMQDEGEIEDVKRQI